MFKIDRTDWKYSSLGVFSLISSEACLICIRVEKESYCSGWIMSPSAPRSLDRPTWRPEKTKESMVWIVMDVTLQQPEPNPTEHLWVHLKTNKAEHSETWQHALWNAVRPCCDNMSHQVCVRPNMDAVIKVILCNSAAVWIWSMATPLGKTRHRTVFLYYYSDDICSWLFRTVVRGRLRCNQNGAYNLQLNQMWLHLEYVFLFTLGEINLQYQWN